MKQIRTAALQWQADCYNATEKGEPFYVLNLQLDDVDFLAGLAVKFPLNSVWGASEFYFNPPAGAILRSTAEAVTRLGS